MVLTISTFESPLMTDRKSTRLNSSHLVISYAVFCLKKDRYEATTLREGRGFFVYLLPPPTYLLCPVSLPYRPHSLVLVLDTSTLGLPFFKKIAATRVYLFFPPHCPLPS